MVCHQRGFFHGSSDCLPVQMSLAKLWVADWFVTSVDFFMGLQIACLHECFATLWTAEWFVISVDFFMSLQLPHVVIFSSHFEQLDGLSSVWIFSWAFNIVMRGTSLRTLSSWMVSHQCGFLHESSTTWCGELLFALWAAEWFLISVDSFMPLNST